jgi:hypothetical protein
LLQNEYLAAENRILKAHRPGKNNVLLFPALLRLSPVGDVASAVENASAAYSGRMNILTKRGGGVDHRFSGWSDRTPK